MRNSLKRRSWPLILGSSRGKGWSTSLHTDEWHAAQGYARFRGPMIHSHLARDPSKHLVPTASLRHCHTNPVELAAPCQPPRLPETSRSRTLYALLSSTVILLLSSPPSSVNAITTFSSIAASASHPACHQSSAATEVRNIPAAAHTTDCTACWAHCSSTTGKASCTSSQWSYRPIAS